MRGTRLLRYLADPALRARITAVSNKVESYNGLSKWLGFGGVLADNDPEEQEKLIKFNTLLASLVVFHNTLDISEGWSITAAQLAPYLAWDSRSCGEPQSSGEPSCEFVGGRAHGSGPAAPPADLLHGPADASRTPVGTDNRPRTCASPQRDGRRPRRAGPVRSTCPATSQDGRPVRRPGGGPASSGRRGERRREDHKGQEQALWATLSRCGRCNYVTNALKPCDERPGNLSG
ncbi:Tn3 family transposase [Nonomuraea sp. NPDC052129]|uniref:Tn3 family transposase n=1 Tax=Nonomuraea sp. NPDC052129 TaxID=3154651 RepID=UPI0034280C2F